MVTKSCEKVAVKFVCESCHYFTSRKSSFDKHLSTSKHFASSQCNKNVTKSCEKVALTYLCKICRRDYKSRVGLWRHMKTCIEPSCETPDIITAEEPSTPELLALISQLVKGQNVLQDSILEICKNGTHNTNSHNTNSHNKSFNLQFFLNETCKDAMNITDFVDSITPLHI